MFIIDHPGEREEKLLRFVFEARNRLGIEMRILTQILIGFCALLISHLGQDNNFDFEGKGVLNIFFLPL